MKRTPFNTTGSCLRSMQVAGNVRATSSTRPDASAAQTPAAISASARDSSRPVEPSRQERRYDEVLSQAYEGTNQVTGVFYYKVRRHVKYKVTVQSTADRMEFEPDTSTTRRPAGSS